ncbi:MAG: DNA polymerase III, partial [Methanobacteriota archaeon]
MKNQEVAKIFYEIADFLDIQGVQFKPNAYRRAARIIEDLQEDLANIKKRGKLTDIQGIGKNLAVKIDEYLESGEIGLHKRLRSEVPQGLLEIIAVPGVGPKTAGYLYKERGISSLEALEKAARERRLRQMKGFGQKTEENVLKGIEMLKRMKGRILLGEALPIAEEVIEEIKSKCKVERISVAGSVRRMKETIGDIDILVVSEEKNKVMDIFSNLSGVKDVIVKGPTKTSVYLHDDLQADLRVVDSGSYGAALQYFTGSKDHNIHLRRIAQKMGYKVNEYGLFKGDEKIAGETEEQLYETLGMYYIEPELREDGGEIEASQAAKLPKLVRLEDIKGDLHVHTDWSDGTESIQDLAKISHSMGYEYIAVADHSKSLKIAGGLDEDELTLQIKEIRKINKKMEDFRILAGIEVDILGNGELDLEDSVLKKMDVVV